MILAVASTTRQFVMVSSESPIRVRPGLMLLFKSGSNACFSVSTEYCAQIHTKHSFGSLLNHTAAGKLPWALIYLLKSSFV